MVRFLRSEGGYSLVFWAAFFAFVALPLLVLGMEMGRYARAAGEVQKAADLAALAAAQEVDVPAFRETGQIILKPEAYGVAQAYAAANAGYLGHYHIGVGVTNISVNQAAKTVRVTCAASVGRLFPGFVNPTIVRTGEAQVALR